MARFEQIGRYRITRELGKGAMGEVFLAYDPDLDREVAIKTIYYDPGIPENELKEAKLRFLREARVAAKLNHPNIVIIHDVGEHEGIPFIAMECIHGETLEQYVKPVGLLPFHRVTEIVGQAGDALDFAHKNDLVHRDIKPSNIMITQSGSVKVMDFGLAKKPTANLTQAGMLLGTPSYMSPEQIKGETLDGRSDLFSLGVVLYQMLTGEKPFPGEGITTIIHKILNEAPKAPTILNAKLPSQFDGIIQKALAKEPAARFQSGREMKTALMNYADFTARMSRIQPGKPRVVDAAEDTAAMSQSSLPIATAPKPARNFTPLFKGLAAAAILAVALFVAATPAKGWVKEKSMDSNFPLPTFLIVWANDGVNPRLLKKTIYVEVERGALLTFDGRTLETPTFELSVTDGEEHVVAAESGCKRAEKKFRAADVEKSMALALTPAMVEVQISSVPPGATLRYGSGPSQATAVTPAALRLSACESHDIALSLDGYFDLKDHISVALDKKNVFPPYMLQPLPKPGRVNFAKGAYPYEVQRDGQTIAKGGEEKSLAPGRYHVMFVNKAYFFEHLGDFEVAAEKTTFVSPKLPGLGMLKVMCYTSATVFVNDARAPDLPIDSLKISAGKHLLKCVFTGEGKVMDKEVEIQEGRTTEVRFAQDQARVVTQ